MRALRIPIGTLEWLGSRLARERDRGSTNRQPLARVDSRTTPEDLAFRARIGEIIARAQGLGTPPGALGAIDPRHADADAFIMPLDRVPASRQRSARG
jgi:hypothetical protein